METTLPKSFYNLIQSHDKPLLVDFWAEWCGPCHAIAPTIKQIAKDFSGRLTVIKVNIDEKPEIAQHYAISSIPTLMVFKAGQQVWRQSGALPYPQLKSQMESLL